jgi:hypothetical protein
MTSDILQILPCHIDKEGVQPDLEKYFVHDGKNANFRGRKLLGVTIELGNFKGNWKNEEFSQVLMWHHDTPSDSLSQVLKVMETLNDLNE